MDADGWRSQCFTPITATQHLGNNSLLHDEQITTQVTFRISIDFVPSNQRGLKARNASFFWMI